MKTIMLSLMVSACCFAKPISYKCVAGHLTYLTKSKDQLEIETCGNTIIEWNRFSISPRNTVVFHQDKSTSAILNRVKGGKRSHILGNIESNGKVYLLNPNGIVINKGSIIKTADFIASTGQIKDLDFLSGKDLCIQSPGKGFIYNEGTIQSDHGSVILVGRRVLNLGTLEAPYGTAGIASGYEVVIKPNGPERIFIQPYGDKPVGGKHPSIENYGSIKALICELKSNRNPYASAIHAGGSIEATQVKQSHGQILLTSPEGSIHVRGKLNADKGRVCIRGKDVCFQHGFIQAKGGFVQCVADTIDFPSYSKIMAQDGVVDLKAQVRSLIGGDIFVQNGRLKLRTIKTAAQVFGRIDVGKKGIFDKDFE